MTHLADAHKATTKTISPAARAKTKHAQTVQNAKASGHIVDAVPREDYRTDIVPPVLAFVVYGVPSPQGSKKPTYRGGKLVLQEMSDGLGPWRDAVRSMSVKAVADYTKRTGRPWKALDEAVMVSAVVTRPATAAATKRGDVYVTGTPDLDKLQRAIGDAISPKPLSPREGKGMTPSAKEKVRDALMAQRRKQAVLHDDSRIAAWDRVMKVYPATIVDSLGYSGALIQIWRMADLERAARRPTFTTSNGGTAMLARDLRTWGRPADGTTWDEACQAAWANPQAVMDTVGPVVLPGRAVTAQGVRAVCRALALTGPNTCIAITASKAA